MTETSGDGAESSEVVEAPHEISVLVWDGPSPAIAGASAKVTVGVRCAHGCALDGQAVEVRDAAGAVAGRAVLQDQPWPDADALYWAQVTFLAPATTGPAEMTAACAPEVQTAPHVAGRTAFGFRVDPRPDHEVRVRVVFGLAAAPVAGVEVWMNHYTRVTDAAGEARFSLPRGAYTCSIRKLGLAAEPVDVEVSSDQALEITAVGGETREELEARLSAWESYPWS